MPQLPHELIRARAARLRTAAAERRSAWLGSLVESSQAVLIENNGKGHTDSFAPVRIDGAVRGDAGLTRITGLHDDHLTAMWA
jgi:threonylcarbamoyladenosine tRNA methylthiotransferase MtaB